ncbi:hypothetical protein F4225_13170 [Candidatus Poribacteria bacterium]|nr:hypothetical protein [Candidatus Poribacteria bacterium]MYF56661.1 hypothetical protein [Candidatus Poribacteria bacterium]
MKKHISVIISVLTLSTLILTQVDASGPPPTPRALPEGAKMRIGQGRGVDFAFSPDGNQFAIACSFIGIWIHDAHTGEEITLLTGHTDAVTAVEYSPDGKVIASGSFDKTVRLWDAQTYQHLATFTGHTGDTNALAFSPDGKTLASGAARSSKIRRNNFWGNLEEGKEPEKMDGSVRLWDIKNKKEKLTLTGHTGWIAALKFSPDDTMLASASTDGTVRLWNAKNGKQNALLKGGGKGPNTMLFSPDSKRIATQSFNDAVRLWDTQTGKMIAVFQECNFGVIAFSPDSSTFVTCHGNEMSTARLWDANTGKPKAELDAKLNSVVSIAYSSDGLRIVSTEDQQNTTIRWLDVNKQKGDSKDEGGSNTIKSPLKTLTLAGTVSQVAFSPEGSKFAAWNSNEIQLWDTDTGSQNAKFKYPGQREHRYGRPFVLFSKDGKTFACGDGTSKIWLFDGETYKHHATLNGHTGPVIAAALSPDGETFASASKDKTLRLWDVKTGQTLANLKGHSDTVMSLAFSSDSKNLASGSADKTIFLWDVYSGKPRKMLVGHTEKVENLLFSNDQTVLASASEKEVRVWNTATGEKRFSLEGHPWSTRPLAFSPDGKTLATGGEWEIQLWDAYTGKHKQKLSGHLDNNFILTFSPDGKSLVSSGKTTQLWDVETGKNVSTFSERSGAFPLLFSSDSKILYGDFGGNIEIWDVQLRQRIKTLNGHSSNVTSMALSPKDGVFASASYDGTVVLWEPIQRADKNMVVKIMPSSDAPTVGKQQKYNINIVGGEDVAGYQLTLAYDETKLRYISSSNGDFLPGRPFFMQPIQKKNTVTIASTALIGTGNGDGTLATITFEIVDTSPSSLKITDLILSDKKGKRLRPTVKNEEEN